MINRSNKAVVRKLNKGFEAGDAVAILSCLADDVFWFVPGAFTANGKEEFRKQIRHEDFTGDPVITVKNEIEEGNCLAVEGEVASKMKDGTPFRAYFHNTYLFENGKIKKMTSYLVPKRE